MLNGRIGCVSNINPQGLVQNAINAKGLSLDGIEVRNTILHSCSNVAVQGTVSPISDLD